MTVSPWTAMSLLHDKHLAECLPLLLRTLAELGLAYKNRHTLLRPDNHVLHASISW